MNIEREIVTLTPLPLITTMTGALDCCWKGSGMPAKVMADRLGIEYRHFMRMFNVDDSRHFPPDLIEMIMRESRNTLPLEWLAARMGYRIHEQSLGKVAGCDPQRVAVDRAESTFCNTCQWPD